MFRFLFIMLMLAAVIGFNRVHATSSNKKALSIEVFTIMDRQVRWELEAEIKEAYQHIDFQVYELNRIQLVETELSNDLPTDSNQSKQITLQRIQRLDKRALAAVQNASVGLAKAMQYGVDRYPAIMFDGDMVVYGLTDLRVALDHYQTWRAGARP